MKRRPVMLAERCFGGVRLSGNRCRRMKELTENCALRAEFPHERAAHG